MRTWIRIVVIATLVLTTLRLDGPPPVSAATTRIWTHETVMASGLPVAPVWVIKQTISVKITYNAAGNPTYATFLWANCKVAAMFVKITVSWCGVTRINALTFDSGFNFEKEVAWGTAQSTCWVRATWRAAGNIRTTGFPTAAVGPTRNGC